MLNISGEDIRHLTGTQDFVAQAPVNLVYVADLERMPLVEPEQRLYLAAIGVGCISQNVFLLCAAESTVPRALIDRRSLSAAMGLRPAQRIILAQRVGHPLDPLGSGTGI